jgi:tetratricopeptide (TPR) repeat protein
VQQTAVLYSQPDVTTVASRLCGQASLANDLAFADVLAAAGEIEAATAELRTSPRRFGVRPDAVATTLSAAERDPGFRALVAEADAARDARDFTRGEYLYWRALALYPLHYGYATQYAHCLKEQGKFAEAEGVYRSALALGGAAEDLHEHITAVAAARGAEPALPTADLPVADPLDLRPTRNDVALLFALLLHRSPASHEETLDLLRACPRRRDVAQALIRRDEFARANTDLMVLLAEAR